MPNLTKKLLMISFVLLLALVGCSNKDKANEEKTKQDQKADASVEFRGVSIEYDKETKEVLLTGDANASNGYVYYEVGQDDEILLKEQKIALEKENKWTPIEVRYPVKDAKDPDGALIFTLYGKDQKDIKVNQNHIPANLIQMR